MFLKSKINKIRFVFFLGKQLGLQKIFGKNSIDDLLIKPDTMSNGHVIKLIHDNQSNPSINSFSTFFSTLTSSSPSKYYKKLRNGVLNHRENHSIYHELSIHEVDDDNNNKKTDENDQNSTIINLSNDDSNNDITRVHFLGLFLITILYFIWFIFIAGISIVPVIIYSALTFLYLLSDRTRRFTLAILIYFTYLFLYDSLHLIPNYTVSKVHIADVYSVEKRLFGVYKNGQLMTLNEYFQLNHIPLLDVITGLCYLHW